MTTDCLAAPSLRRPSLTTPPQAFWLTAQAAFLVGVVAWQSAVHSDAMTLFCTDASGIKLAIVAALLTGANFACLLGGFWLLNRMTGPGRGLLRNGLLGLLCCVTSVLFYLPALFTLWVGPAAIQIRTLMLQP